MNEFRHVVFLLYTWLLAPRGASGNKTVIYIYNKRCFYSVTERCFRETLDFALAVDPSDLFTTSLVFTNLC